ncbi:MAG: galactokinase [Chloroflexota bacterium]|nr:galactokinase [Chloroflexota bacterium]
MILSRAPLRITLGGGGTDLPSYADSHGGFILSAAIDKYVYVNLNRPAADDLIRVKYSRYEEVSSPSMVQHDLVRPALVEMGVTGNIEITSMADVPAGTGLGSSATYVVALLTGLHELQRRRVPTQALAEQACRIEMDLAGHAVGKHDHYLAAFGGLTCLEIEPDGRVTVTPLDITVSATDELRNNLLLFFTGITRNADEILQQQKNDTSAGRSEVIDSLHRTKELGWQIKGALQAGRVDEFGEILDEHWQNKKRRSDAISNPDVDHWYENARKNGALGGKLVGAGGGGFLLLYCPGQSKAAVRDALGSEGLREMPFAFDFEGAKVMLNI